MKALRLKGVDTIIYYHISCNGRPPIIKLENGFCADDESKFLFWIEKKKWFMQRFDECSDHRMIPTLLPFDKFIGQGYAKIRAARIRYPEYPAMINGKKVILTESVSHSCRHIFEIHTGTKILTKETDEFALNTKYIDDKHYNINYKHNQKAILNKLTIAVQKEIDKYNENKFSKQR